MKPNWSYLIDRAVEEGISLGWNRAHKHTSTPSPETIKTDIYDAVSNSLSTIIDWEAQ